MQRSLYACLIFGAHFFFTACISKQVQVPILLPQIREATLQELVDIVNQYQTIQTLTTRLDLQFQSEQDIERGLGRQYRTAVGRILLARPGKIRLKIEIPIVKTDIVDLASDGERFQVMVYPKEHRTFIQGTNNRRYTGMREDRTLGRRRREAGALAHVRPQHFIEALLIPPVDQEAGRTILVKEEVRRVEPDSRPAATRRSRVMRTYWVLSVIERKQGEAAVLRRKYWFDGTRDLPLVREQLYAGNGALLADISFDDLVRRAQFQGFIPTKIRVRRPQDNYSVTLSLQVSTLDVNLKAPNRAFRLEKPVEWSDVETIDLDELSKARPAS